MSYTVMADVLDHVVKEAGEYPDGRPKQVEELHKGDTTDLSDVDDDRIQALKDAGAIMDTKEAEKQAKEAEQATPPPPPAGGEPEAKP
jgi:hypothetical protein